ncbi:MAG TPA: PhnD/SsuA/transferrin family substrate-binding protein, partial [Acidimicrobiales bacterium]|nr:PhnD/SsuA/transferrin family substrate-binding protein [Acidimicrobiales bacterium]
MTGAVRLGAVAYDPKVVTIWDGFRVWLRQRGLDFDYVLYSNYERQVEELVGGSIDVAWNSPLAWVRTRRMAPSATSLVMRDTDQDLVSVVVVRADSPATDLDQLEDAT